MVKMVEDVICLIHYEHLIIFADGNDTHFGYLRFAMVDILRLSS